MKEYLVKDKQTGKYYVDNNPASYDEAIEIPEGAKMLTKDLGDYLTFWNGELSINVGDNHNWMDPKNDGVMGFDKYKSYGFKILWQRQPESPNPLFDVNWFDGDLKEAKLDKQLSKVDLTLLERQSQYGCFEDVAFVTQGIIALLRKCNYDNMPQPHQMALYMIASKMARLVNGDHNHIDGWHDIGGYSKLIENLIGGENE